MKKDTSTEKPNSSNRKNTLSSEQSGPFQWKSRRKLLRLSPKRGSWLPASLTRTRTTQPGKPANKFLASLKPDYALLDIAILILDTTTWQLMLLPPPGTASCWRFNLDWQEDGASVWETSVQLSSMVFLHLGNSTSGRREEGSLLCTPRNWSRWSRECLVWAPAQSYGGWSYPDTFWSWGSMETRRTMLWSTQSWSRQWRKRSEWQSNSFEYVGCSYVCSKEEVLVTQTNYVEGRVDKITAKSNENGEISRKQIEENRASIGSLSWLAKQTGLDLQFSVSQVQEKQANPSAEDLKKTNKLVDQAAAFRLNGVKIKKIPEEEIFFVAFHDAAWGNVDREDPDIGSPEWTGEHPVSSQLAHVILICGAKLLDGEESDFSLIDWRSKCSQRVCRSTFAGETMACCKALEHSIYLRSLFISFADGRLVQEKDCGAYVPIHCITDCKDLYDRLMREGTPKAPTEKRLAIDLAGPRQILMKEARHQFVKKHGDNQEPTPSMPCRPPIHWVPTELQLADILTKELKSAE